MKKFYSVQDLLTVGETALCLFTDGQPLNINDDKKGEVVSYDFDPKLSFQRIIIYQLANQLGLNVARLFSALPDNIVEAKSDINSKEKYLIKYEQLQEVGITEVPWDYFIGSSKQPIAYVTKINSPAVSCIRIDYEDGSNDIIKLTQDGELMLYNLDRKNSVDEKINSGFYTNGAIAATLFLTAISNHQIEYKSHDPKVIKLLKSWFDEKVV